MRREGTEYYGKREDEAKTPLGRKDAPPPSMPPPLAIIPALLLHTLSHRCLP